MALQAGDVVALKSGGPLMTIQEMHEDGAHCVWFEQGLPRYATFPAATVDKIASGAHQAVDRVASAATSAAEQWGVKGDQMLEQGDRMMESTREYVRNNPMAALGIALAAGFILSKIL